MEIFVIDAKRENCECFDNLIDFGKYMKDNKDKYKGFFVGYGNDGTILFCLTDYQTHSSDDFDSRVYCPYVPLKQKGGVND